jgi:hypothetical protein
MKSESAVVNSSVLMTGSADQPGLVNVKAPDSDVGARPPCNIERGRLMKLARTDGWNDVLACLH